MDSGFGRNLLERCFFHYFKMKSFKVKYIELK